MIDVEDREKIHYIHNWSPKGEKTMNELIFKTRNFSEGKKDQNLCDMKEAAMYLQKLTCNGKFRNLV